MDKQLLWLLAFLAFLGVLIGATVLLHKWLRLTNEQSRKFLHVSGGFLCLLLPSVFQSHWWVLALAMAAFLILLYTFLRKMLPSIHETRRYSIGSVLFPLPVYGCFLAAELNHQDIFFYLPVSLLAISDTAAEFGGAAWGAKTRSFFHGQKSLAGTLCFFFTAILVTAGWLYFRTDGSAMHILLIGGLIVLLATAAELVTLHGWDNLTVPAVTVICLQLTT